MDQQRNRLLKMKEVLALTALSKASVYDLIKRGQFPKQIRLGKNSVAWVESEVYGWINQKIEMNRNILSPQ
jgi:prophage regulatory protein